MACDKLMPGDSRATTEQQQETTGEPDFSNKRQQGNNKGEQGDSKAANFWQSATAWQCTFKIWRQQGSNFLATSDSKFFKFVAAGKRCKFLKFVEMHERGASKLRTSRVFVVGSTHLIAQTQANPDPSQLRPRPAQTQVSPGQLGAQTPGN